MEENAQVEEPTTQAEQQDVVNERVNSGVEEQMKELEKIRAYNAKLLEENKYHADKYKRLRDSVEEKELVKLEANNNYKAIKEKLEEKNKRLQEQLQELGQTAANKSFMFEVTKTAQDIKPEYVEDVISNIRRNPLLEIDDDLSVKGISEAIDELRQQKPDFFASKKSAAMYNAKPKKATTSKLVPNKENLSEWKTDDLKGYLLQNYK